MKIEGIAASAHVTVGGNQLIFSQSCGIIAPARKNEPRGVDRTEPDGGQRHMGMYRFRRGFWSVRRRQRVPLAS